MYQHRIRPAIIAWLYKKVLRPILFTQDPERVHDCMLFIGNLLGKYQITKMLAQRLLAYQHRSLEQNIFGKLYSNPVGLSAGFDKDVHLVNLLPSIGFGFIQIGSITAKPYSGNPKPRLHRLPHSKSIVVNYGLKNIGVKRIVTKLKNSKLDKIPISISIAKTNCPETSNTESGITDYIQCLSTINNAGLGDVYTLNISCPNAFGGEPFTKPAKLDKLLTQVSHQNIQKPLLIKMPSDLPWQEFKDLLDVIIKRKYQGVIISNLTKNRANLSPNNPLPKDIKGGISGLPTQQISNKLISQTYKYCGDKLIIVGVGGIFSAQDAYDKIRHGATLVQLITGLIYEGPQLIGQINYGLVQLLKKDGYKHISEAVGTHTT